MSSKLLVVIAVALLVAFALSVLSGASRGTAATPGDLPGWLDPAAFRRRLALEDLGPGSGCRDEVASALDGGRLDLAFGAGCRLLLPAERGPLRRPRLLPLRVLGGAVRVVVEQRGRGEALVLERTVTPGDPERQPVDLAVTRRGGSLTLTCAAPAGCVVDFPR